MAPAQQGEHRAADHEPPATERGGVHDLARQALRGADRAPQQRGPEHQSGAAGDSVRLLPHDP